jgi:hypothetical protein
MRTRRSALKGTERDTAVPAGETEITVQEEVHVTPGQLAVTRSGRISSTTIKRQKSTMPQRSMVVVPKNRSAHTAQQPTNSLFFSDRDDDHFDVQPGDTSSASSPVHPTKHSSPSEDGDQRLHGGTSIATRSCTANGIGNASSVRKNGPKYLDDTTMSLFTSYLNELQDDDVLDDDELMERSVRLCTTAHQHARNHVSSRRTVAAKKTIDEEISDHSEDSDDTFIFDQYLVAEENRTIGHEFFKNIASNITTQNDLGGNGSKTFVLDKKTVSWIKRATRLYRTSSSTAVLSISPSMKAGTKEGETSRRVTTRRYKSEQARDHRQKKRERGLDVLGAAIEEIESDFGARFPIYKFMKSPPKKKSRLSKDEKLDKDRKFKKQHTNGDRLAKKKIQLHDGKGIKHVRTKKTTSAKSVPTIQKVPKVLPRGKKKKRKQSRSSKKICTSLRVLDRAWHEQVHPCTSKYCGTTETETEFRARQSIVLHPRFVTAGIIHRLPWMHTLARNQDFPSTSKDRSTPLHIHDPPRQRYTDKEYATLCHQLVHSLNGTARQFAKYEFFYSDLDREW